MWLLFLFLFIHTASAATIVSQVQSVAVLNGVPQSVTEVTVDFGPSDEGVPFVLDVVNPQTGHTDTLSFTHEPPRYIYTHQLFGWIPRASYPFRNMVCVYDTQPFNSSIQNSPSVELDSLSSGDPFDTSTSFVQRRALGPRHDRKQRVLPSHFLPKVPKSKKDEKAKDPIKKTELPSNTRKKEIPTFRTNVPKTNPIVSRPWSKVQRNDEVTVDTVPIMDTPEIDAGSILGNAAAVSTAAATDSVIAQDSASAFTKLKNGLKVLGGGIGGMIGTAAIQVSITIGINEFCKHIQLPSFLGTMEGALCGSGGNGALQTILNQITNVLQQEEQQIMNISNVLQVQETWDVNTQMSIDQLQTNQQILGNQVQLALNDIAMQQQSINTISQVLSSYINQSQSNFAQIDKEIYGLSGVDAELYNYTNQLSQVVQTQINTILSQLTTLDLSVMQLTQQIFANAYNTGVRRALIAQHWGNIVNAETNLPSCVWAQCLGSPPLTPNGPPLVYDNAANCPASYSTCSYLKSQVPYVNLLNTATNPPAPQSLAEVHNLYSAAMLSMVRLQYTDVASNMAMERQISFNCDKQFLLNNYLPNINFKYMFYFLGPPYNGSDYCYNQGNPGTATWSCDCVVVQTFTSCILASGAPIFPFGWQQTTTLAGSSQISQYCTGEVQQSTLVSESFGITDAIENYGMIFSSSNTWFSFLSALCASSSGWAVSSAGMRVRVTSDATNGFIDMTLSPSTPNVCASDIAVLTLTSSNNTELLAYNIYSYWASGYQIMTTTYLGFWDEQLFGTMLTDTNCDYLEFNQRPDIQQTGACTIETVLKYAGTGIPLSVSYNATLQSNGYNPDPYLLDPTQVTNGDQYPPMPAFSELSNAPGNTNKLPVYSIAPITQTYNPTLTINGGDCVVINGSCTTPLNGLNFSTSLSLSLTTEWTNLLPGETVWVGDFNQLYNLGGGQVVYDIPSQLLPQSTSRSSLCNSVLYVVQPRTSPYATDPLFNIPDTDTTTDINAVDWASYYNTFFDPTCASESASTYARVVDSSGICQQSVLDNGTILDFVPGNYETCTLMNAFWVIVPNYVSSFMYFQPRQYTAQATFVVPQGELIQQISTACPTSFNVIMPNGTSGSVNVTFFTNSTTIQTATFVVTGYGVCSTSQSTTFTFSATKPYTVGPIPACGTQYGQVYPYLSNQPCYSSPGIEMYRAYSSNDGPITPSTTVTYVSDISNSLTSGLVNIMMQLLSIQSAIMMVPFAANSSEAINEQYSALVQQQISTIQNANLSITSPTLQSLIGNAQLILANNSQQVAANLAVQYELVQVFNNVSEQLNLSITRGNALTQQIVQATTSEQTFVNATNIQITGELQQIRSEIADLGGGSSGGSSCILSIIPVFGNWVCDIWNGLTGSLGSIFASLFSIVVILALCFCGICVCVAVFPELCQCTCGCLESCFRKMAQKKKERQQQQQQKNKQNTGARYDTLYTTGHATAFDDTLAEFDSLRTAANAITFEEVE